eukprot:GHVO01052873.1.p1 GENE.GHVO01052873.1~~GHVO01052873.1.p1  ORF type:complete len:204 (-),score=32.34 GHVO01052873.1:258-869(-)
MIGTMATACEQWVLLDHFRSELLREVDRQLVDENTSTAKSLGSSYIGFAIDAIVVTGGLLKCDGYENKNPNGGANLGAKFTRLFREVLPPILIRGSDVQRFQVVQALKTLKALDVARVMDLASIQVFTKASMEATFQSEALQQVFLRGALEFASTHSQFCGSADAPKLKGMVERYWGGTTGGAPPRDPVWIKASPKMAGGVMR